MLTKQQHALHQQKFKFKHDEKKVAVINSQLLEINDRLTSARWRKRRGLVTMQRQEASRVTASFRDAQNHMATIFEAMTEMHRNALDELDRVE